MKKYKDSGAADEFKQKKKQAEKERKASEKKAKAPAAKKPKAVNAGAGTGGKFTSKEYIEDDDSSSDSDNDKAKDKKKDTKDVSGFFDRFNSWIWQMYIPSNTYLIPLRLRFSAIYGTSNR